MLSEHVCLYMLVRRILHKLLDGFQQNLMGVWERGQGNTHYIFGGIQEYNLGDCWDVYALLSVNANLRDRWIY